MRPNQTILVLETLQKRFVGPLHRKGIELSLNDSQTVLEVYQQWLLLLVDYGYLHHETLEKVAARLLTDMVKADVLDLNNDFAELLNRIRIQNFKGFKALCSRISTHLYSLIEDDVVLVSQSDVYAASRLIQLFSYTSRLTLNDIDLTQQCLDDYMATENEMSPYLPRNLTSSLNKIIKGWMKSFDTTSFTFHHGPGGVAGHGKTSLNHKYKDLTYDQMLTYAFGEPHWSTGPIRSSFDRISQTIFVPKSYKTFRTISMEPSTLQYMQQGILGEIQRVVASSWWLKSHISFRDQERNQRLAREGSISRNYATIDLSAASDSVSYALVCKLFVGTPLFRYLVATRSTRTLLPDGRLINLKKFAPMGSALCFPVETIIFAAICQYVTREHGVTKDYSVYGDDIIVPTQCVSDTMLILETLGFSVNRGKSFYDSTCWFRESCGGEYCDGFDVTPMKVSRRYKHEERDVQIAGLIDLANAAYKKGFRNLRAFFIRKLRDAKYVALFAPTSLMSDNYTNYHTKRRWNPNLQRIECRISDVHTKYKGKKDEDVRYRHWLESTANRLHVGDGFRSETRRPTVKIQSRWANKPYEGHDQPFVDFFTQ